ncbi:esterase/lipase family protein [Lysobacter solisilvae (ex Woo and Kim 2020)]|uniref:Alpha/beta hydrolase n=1 Tax=Agrilutibacter terrestris TaxID=2865112 RepID=A0A7H0FXM7_9GAMM|nr:alpha/beta hydrolase [Lysobacter terrestris]QNP40793.1 alpha/beta hydrolase [Lysobacter terrestris]
MYAQLAALRATEAAATRSASSLSQRCTDQLLFSVLAEQPSGWSPGRRRMGGVPVDVEFRGLSEYLHPPLRIALARTVQIPADYGVEQKNAGFGVPVVLLSPRCTDRPPCELLPPEGVFRAATAWVEVDDAGDSVPRLVIANPFAIHSIKVGDQALPMARNMMAAYALGTRTSKLPRLAIWGLLGGHEIGRRAGVYLLDDYDPNKRPLVMIHGLGSSPLIWARLSNAVWASNELSSRYQVWHIVYQTNAPTLVSRYRIQGYLDKAWKVLDPEHDDPARQGIVLVGHSMGGLVARMLCEDSGDVLWNAAFHKPPSMMEAEHEDIAAVQQVFVFRPYPGVRKAIFLATPHRGSPSAKRWFGRLARLLVGRRTPELQSLRRLARADPSAVRSELRHAYGRAAINSISTLRVSQPVRRAGESLMPAAGISYHTIAGSLRRHNPPGDGVVPLDSAKLDGATSTLIIDSGHEIYKDPRAVAEVVRILEEDATGN